MKRFHNICKLLLISLAFTITACGGGGGGGNPVDPGNGPYTVSGTVTDSNGNGVSGVTITFTASGYEPFTKLTSANGTYTISIQDEVTFSVTASLGTFDITPASRQVTVDKNITGIDFTLESTILRYSPLSVVVPAVNETMTVDIMVDNVSKFFAAAFTMTYDPSIIEVTDVIASGDGFMFSDAGTPAVLPPIVNYEINPGQSEVTIGSLIGNGYTGANGSGKIATVRLLGKISGTSQLGFVTDGSMNLILSSYISADVQEEHVPLTYTGTVTVTE